MKHGLVEIDWAYVGSVLAQSDDIIQTLFFKSFVKECKSWGTHFQVESQLAGVNRMLTDDEKEVLGMIGWND